MLRKLRKEIITSYRDRRISVFFLFLFFAFIILIFTKLSKEYTNTITFDIKKQNVPQEIVILNDSANAKLNISLKTLGFKWLSYYFSQPEITIDFSKDVTKTNSSFIWGKSKLFQYSDEQFGDNVEIFDASPDTLIFSYDVNLVKKIPVVINTDVKFASGFDLTGNYFVNPDSIVVIGPEIIASKINKIETEKLTLNEVKSNISESVNLKLPKNTKDLNFSINKVKVSGQVEKYTEGTLKIPVIVKNIPEGITLNYFPKEVNVTYYTSLKNFNSVNSKDFMVECDFDTLEDEQAFLTPKITKKPESVKNARVDQQHIEFIILE